MMRMHRFCLFLFSGLLTASAGLPALSAQEKISIDARAASTAFPHFWEQTFGSGRAILSLRESWRNDLRTAKQATGLESVRFHGILMDEVGLYDPDRSRQDPGLAVQKLQDTSAYNFSYIDQIYDGLLANHVRPYVELSFMPRKMAADPTITQPFWYKPVVSPPKDYALWDGMMQALGKHLVERYGLDEVATWKFEVWNEPNLDFWGGRPNQSTYWTLYDHTARALKAVSPKLQVGGPSTAQAAWVPEFLAHCKAENVPVDFVSTHVYANDTADNVMKTAENIPRQMMVYRAVKMVHDQIVSSAYPKLPLIFSEYGASYSNEPNVTDTTYMGPWLANTIRLVDGLATTMAYWDFSDVFEEQGVVQTPFYGGFGIIAADSIPKASFNAFSVLHKLGQRRLKIDSDSALATTTADGAVIAALWNYAPPTGEGAAWVTPAATTAPAKSFELHVEHVPADAAVELYRVDEDHGNVLKAFNAMGRPAGSLTREQIKQLQAAGAMAPAEKLHLVKGSVTINVPVYGLAVVVVSGTAR